MALIGLSCVQFDCYQSLQKQKEKIEVKALSECNEMIKTINAEHKTAIDELKRQVLELENEKGEIQE